MRRMSPRRKLLAALVFLGSWPAPLRAENACSNKNLQGSFGFNLAGTNVAVGQFAFVGKFVADGKGQFVGGGTESVAGSIYKTPFDGSYTVNPDCTGSAQLNFPGAPEPANLDFILVADGDEIFIIDSDNGTIEAGTARKQFSRLSH